MSVGKVLLWVGGGVVVLACLGVVFLYGMAGYAMWASGKEMDREMAAREAAFKAMTPEQHLAMAKEALAKERDPAYCLALLKSVPEGTQGRAELLAEATKQQEAKYREDEAFRAMTPEQHFTAAKAALAAGDPYGCRGHLMWVPREMPGRAEVAAEADREAEALEAAQGSKQGSKP